MKQITLPECVPGLEIRVFRTSFAGKPPNDLLDSCRKAVITRIVNFTSTGWCKHVHFKVKGSDADDLFTYFSIRGSKTPHYVFKANQQLVLF